MKYSVVNSHASPPRVLMTFPFAWMAAAVAGAYGGEQRGYDVAVTPTRPQDFINVCTHRDDLAARLQETVDELMALVARDEQGEWTTVYDAEFKLGKQTAELLDRLTAA